MRAGSWLVLRSLAGAQSKAVKLALCSTGCPWAISRPSPRRPSAAGSGRSSPPRRRSSWPCRDGYGHPLDPGRQGVAGIHGRSAGSTGMAAASLATLSGDRFVRDWTPVEETRLARLLHVGQPGNFRTIDVAILGQRVGARHAEAAAEGGELGRAQVLIPEDQHRMLGEGSVDLGEGVCLEWLRQIDPEDLGSQRCAEGAKLRCLCHGRLLHSRRLVPAPPGAHGLAHHEMLVTLWQPG